MAIFITETLFGFVCRRTSVTACKQIALESRNTAQVAGEDQIRLTTITLPIPVTLIGPTINRANLRLKNERFSLRQRRLVWQHS